jgi:putative ABC transport system ATP-binding protein
MHLAIEANQVCKTYGNGTTAVQAVKGVDFAAAPGEFVAIMGPSGSGKSTLLAMLGGLELPNSGTVSVKGTPLHSMSEAKRAVLRRERIGFVFQSFNLLPVLTAQENVALPLLLAGQKAKTVEDRANRALGQVGLSDRAHHRPAELSGGEQQRVAIARALVTEPAIVLADEPTGNLDSRNSSEVMQTLRHAADALQQTVVLITHDPLVAAWADRVVFLLDGRMAGAFKLDDQSPAGRLTGPRGALPVRASAIRQQYEAVTGGGVA